MVISASALFGFFVLSYANVWFQVILLVER